MEIFPSVEHFSLRLSKAAWNVRDISHSVVFGHDVGADTSCGGELRSRTWNFYLGQHGGEWKEGEATMHTTRNVSEGLRRFGRGQGSMEFRHISLHGKQKPTPYLAVP